MSDARKSRATLEARKRELETLIDESPSWGAYVGALCEELSGVERAIKETRE